jgi:hypothetical protein
MSHSEMQLTNLSVAKQKNSFTTARKAAISGALGTIGSRIESRRTTAMMDVAAVGPNEIDGTPPTEGLRQLDRASKPHLPTGIPGYRDCLARLFAYQKNARD